MASKKAGIPGFNQYKKIIEYGDSLLAYQTPENVQLVKVTERGVLSNRHGSFLHSDMVGKPFGTKIQSAKRSGYIILLFPTPEIWTTCLPHRTQILYLPDISFISSYLELKPGAKMIEAGTGSGSFSHSIARSIAPHGKLYSFEYHAERARIAKSEFASHGIDNVVHAECRDVCKDGFGVEGVVTAVFLDLPSPWEAVPHTKKAFKKNRVGRICCFSPNIEQGEKTCIALRDNDFTDIKMYESLAKTFEFRQIRFKDIPAGAKLESPAAVRAKKRKRAPEELVEGSWEEVGPEAIARYQQELAAIGDKQEGEVEQGGVDSKGKGRANSGDEDDIKMDKGDNTAGEELDGGDIIMAAVDGGGATSESKQAGQSVGVSAEVGKRVSQEVTMSRPKAQMRTHTSYLTFASLMPRSGATEGEMQHKETYTGS